MVEDDIYLDNIFHSLSDATRRDILRRLMKAQYTIGELAQKYDMSFAAVAKHLNVLKKAELVKKEQRGNQQIVSIAAESLRDANHYLAQYEVLWNARFDALDGILKENI